MTRSLEKKNEIKKLERLEEIVAVQTKKKRVETAVLGTLALAGVLTMAAMAPNIVQILRYVAPNLNAVGQKQTVRRAIGRMIKEGYIQKEDGGYRITESGKSRLEKQLHVARMQLTKNAKRRKWDKKWRIVIFDIKETRRPVRDELRALLVRTGFVRMQNSVWVYPHRCDEVVALLKFHLTLGRDLVYIIADAIEGDDELRKHFGLPSAT